MAEALLLVADGKFHACEAVGEYFEAVGFEVVTVQDGGHCVAVLKNTCPDVLLLGTSLLASEGLQILTELRAAYNGAIVLLTGDGESLDQVAAFDLGADDIVALPVDFPVLAARIRAILRRLKRDEAPVVGGDVIKYDNFEISRDRFELKLGGVKVDIPPKELQLLYCLASNPNRVFSREQLLEHVWDFAFLGDSRTVDVHIKRLREKLKGASEKWALSTVWGIGYKFELK